jgi:hypothetical protein
MNNARLGLARAHGIGSAAQVAWVRRVPAPPRRIGVEHIDLSAQVINKS